MPRSITPDWRKIPCMILLHPHINKGAGTLDNTAPLYYIVDGVSVYSINNLFPVPQAEINSNPEMVQNTHW